MRIQVLMPALGLTMEQGKVVQWLIPEGKPVAEGQPLFELESEKATIEIMAPVSGTLEQVITPAGDDARVGEVIAWINDHKEGSPVHPVSPAFPDAGLPQPILPDGAILPSTSLPQADRGSPRATPVARKIAKEAGLDLSLMRGSGPEGLIGRDDVEREIDKRNNQAAGTNPKPGALTAARAVTAQRMAESSRSTAAVTLTTRAPADNLLQVKGALARKWQDLPGIRPSYDLLVTALAAAALKKHPHFNGSWTGEALVLSPEVHIGIAVDTPQGLFVPVIKNVPGRKIANLASCMQDLIARAKQGRLLPDEMHGGTFTITNLGRYGVEYFTPVINQPELGILGMGMISQVLVVENGKIAIQWSLPLSLTFDHRAIDGAPAAAFLQDLAAAIANVQVENLEQR